MMHIHKGLLVFFILWAGISVAVVSWGIVSNLME